MNMFFLGYIDPGSGFVVASVGGLIIAFCASCLGLFAMFFKKIFSFFKKHKKIVGIFLLASLVGALIITGVIVMGNKSTFNEKIIILGFDGLSPDILEPMMEAGELPNFSKLKEEGGYSRLATTNPSQSPVAWSAFATGKNPGKTGVFDFIVRDAETNGIRLSLSNMKNGKPQRVIKSKCFWEYTTDKNVPAIVINHPLTFPPDKLKGKMLSGMGVPDLLGTEGTFSFYTTETLDPGKDIGGKVFPVKKASVMTMDLLGPRVAGIGGKAENVKVPLKVFLPEGKNVATIGYQNNKFEIEQGRWSGWKEVTFKLGPFKKAKGIFKVYLVQTDPEFKLYISPINFDPRSPFFQISQPAGYAKELSEKIGLYYTQGMPVDTWAMNENRLDEEPFLEQINGVLNQKKKILDLELSRFDKGVLFCYFGASDIVQHMFWRYTDPEHPLYEGDAPQDYKDMIRSWYKKMDAILGEVMSEIDDNTTLIVLSDHGFNTFRRAAHINTWLREQGYLELKDPEAKSGSELLEDIDWSKTKAYSIGFGAIYINQRGREGRGIVAPGRETELLKDEISEKLKKWTDKKHREQVVSNVYKREEIFWGDYLDETPDLYVGFNKGYRASWQTAIGGVPEDPMEDNLKKWSGSHLFDPGLIPGVLFCNRKIEKENPSLYDITPTILEIIGYNEDEIKECDMDGNPLF